MIEQTKKLRLDELQVDSFVTALDLIVKTGDILGGQTYEGKRIGTCRCLSDPPQSCYCTDPISDCQPVSDLCSYNVPSCVPNECPVSNEGGSVCLCTNPGEFQC